MQITEIQKQVLIGGMLGDMCIFKCAKGKHYRMNFAHTIRQKEYFFMKFEILKDIFNTTPKERYWIDKRTKNEYGEIRAQSRTHEFFTELYSKWYKNGKRTVCDDVWGMEWLGFAIWYMDDGFKSRHGGMYLSTNRYSQNDLLKLKEILEKRFDIVVNIQKQRLYIPKKSAEKVREELAKFTPRSMLYKL